MPRIKHFGPNFSNFSGGGPPDPPAYCPLRGQGRSAPSPRPNPGSATGMYLVFMVIPYIAIATISRSAGGQVIIACHVIVGMDSTNPRPRIPGSIPWYWPQRANNRVLDRSNTRCNAEVRCHRGTAYRHPTYPHEQPKWCCRLRVRLHGGFHPGMTQPGPK